jgi:transcriptional regulator GlxA family with amidase domain
MKKISVLILEQSVLTGIVLLMDIFKMAGAYSGEHFNIEIVSSDGKPIKYSDVFHITPDRPATEVNETDLIVIPSSGFRKRDLESYPVKILDWLKKHFEKGTKIAGCCTGVFMLAESGILNKKKATTHWAYADLFRKRYPDTELISDNIITEDGNIFCSGGASAVVDLYLFFIERYRGKKIATKCAKNIVFERGRHIQTPFENFRHQKKHKDFDIIKAQGWIERYFSKNFQIDDISKHVGMSIRNFKRRFKNATGDSPLVYIQKLRVEAAKNLLETGSSAIEEIACKVGYEDIGFFRKLFARYAGISPSLYRQKFKSHQGTSN